MDKLIEQPAPGQAQQVPVTENDIVNLDNIDQFAFAVAGWHANRMARLQNLLEIPEGTEVESQIGEGEPAKAVLTGEAMIAFKAALLTAISEFGQLPFMVSTEDEDSKEAQDADPSAPQGD